MTRAALILTLATALHAAHAAAPPQRVPTLDELLGLEQAPQDTTTPEDSARLDDAITPSAPADPVAEAIRLMDDAATRLVDERDPGITTQRIQESIVLKLDELISSAQQQQSSSSSSSSSSPPQDQQSQPDQRTSPAQQAGSQPGDDSGARPGSDAVAENDSVKTRASWGNLPERLRDALTQGLDDPYSTLYRDLTETYYKKLAEDDE